MKPQWEHLYAEMLTDINRCKSLDLPETEVLEGCCRIARDHWKVIKEVSMEMGFNTNAEEIEFFRDVKPQFTCHIEYYLLLYQATLLVPAAIAKQLKFWQEEALKYKRFYDGNEDFIKYYESGNRYNDQTFFLRTGLKEFRITDKAVYEDEDLRTSHDGIVRTFMANKMYYEFVKEKMAELKEKKT